LHHVSQLANRIRFAGYDWTKFGILGGYRIFWRSRLSSGGLHFLGFHIRVFWTDLASIFSKVRFDLVNNLQPYCLMAFVR
jgi:hypothetical protein